MKDSFKSKGPELLVDLAFHIGEVIKEFCPTYAEKSDEIGQIVASRMAVHWGGQNVYFPMGFNYRLSIRDLKVYSEFNGTNQGDLARKYGVSLQWIYRILKDVHAEELFKRQSGLFVEELSD